MTKVSFAARACAVGRAHALGGSVTTSWTQVPYAIYAKKASFASTLRMILEAMEALTREKHAMMTYGNPGARFGAIANG